MFSAVVGAAWRQCSHTRSGGCAGFSDISFSQYLSPPGTVFQLTYAWHSVSQTQHGWRQGQARSWTQSAHPDLEID